MVAKTCLDPTWPVAPDTQRYAVMTLANISADGTTTNLPHPPWFNPAIHPSVYPCYPSVYPYHPPPFHLVTSGSLWLGLLLLAERYRQQLQQIGVLNACRRLKDAGDELVKVLVLTLERNLSAGTPERTMFWFL